MELAPGTARTLGRARACCRITQHQGRSNVERVGKLPMPQHSGPANGCRIRPEEDSRARAGEAGRIQVDGKFFARKAQRFQIHGVTYGPFAPDTNGDQFPDPERVRADLASMRAGAINSIRVYHLPPDWLLDL